MSGRAQFKALRPKSGSLCSLVAVSVRGTPRSGRHSRESNRSRTSIHLTKNRWTRMPEDRDAASTPRTWSRRQPKPRPCFPTTT